MPKYRRKASRSTGGPPASEQLLGMLYLVECRMLKRASGEKIKHRILMVGCEAADIERKLRWVFDQSRYDEFAVTAVEKVREKVHVLSTSISQEGPRADGPTIQRPDGTVHVPQQNTLNKPYDPNLYAVGLATTVLAEDEDHALRKIGHALINQATGRESQSGARLHEETKLTIEQLARPNGIAKARDVSSEINRATFVRG